jgi:hypothetical protein
MDNLTDACGLLISRDHEQLWPTVFPRPIANLSLDTAREYITTAFRLDSALGGTLLLFHRVTPPILPPTSQTLDCQR